MVGQQSPGWYPDPGGQPATQRWWDGGTWSPVTRPSPPGSAPASTSVSIRTAAPARVTTTPDGVPLARLGTRLAARLLDSLLISLISFTAGNPFASTVMNAFRSWWSDALLAADRGRPMPPMDVLNDPAVQRAVAFYLAVSAVVSAVYTVVQLRFWGATVAKRLFGLRVRPWSGDLPLSWGQALGRWVTGEGVAFVFSLYPLLDYLWPAWDPRRQALHDKLPGTVVVRSRGGR
jgi:uncharacterized RDD family membrane protein YckC